MSVDGPTGDESDAYEVKICTRIRFVLTQACRTVSVSRKPSQEAFLLIKQWCDSVRTVLEGKGVWSSWHAQNCSTLACHSEMWDFGGELLWLSHPFGPSAEVWEALHTESWCTFLLIQSRLTPDFAFYKYLQKQLFHVIHSPSCPCKKHVAKVTSRSLCTKNGSVCVCCPCLKCPLFQK